MVHLQVQEKDVFLTHECDQSAVLLCRIVDRMPIHVITTISLHLFPP